MPFSVTWQTLLEELEGLPEGATLLTPISHSRFHVTDVQDHRVVIDYQTTDETRPLQREQFETLYRRIADASDGFEIDRLPPDADPYAAVWSLHPRIEIDEQAGTIIETDEPTDTLCLESDASSSAASKSASRRHSESGCDVLQERSLVGRRTNSRRPTLPFMYSAAGLSMPGSHPKKALTAIPMIISATSRTVRSTLGIRQPSIRAVKYQGGRDTQIHLK